MDTITQAQIDEYAALEPSKGVKGEKPTQEQITTRKARGSPGAPPGPPATHPHRAQAGSACSLHEHARSPLAHS